MDTKQIYLQCKDKLLLIIRRGVPTETDAEDVLHDVFSRFFLHPPNHIPEEKAPFYLIRCATNAVAQWWRIHSQKERFQNRFESEIPLFHETTPRVEAMKQEDLIRLQAEIAGLPDRQQQAITLHYFGEFTFQSVAEQMDCSEASVRSHIRHGIGKLQDILADDILPVSKGA